MTQMLEETDPITVLDDHDPADDLCHLGCPICAPFTKAGEIGTTICGHVDICVPNSKLPLCSMCVEMLETGFTCKTCGAVIAPREYFLRP